MSGCVATTGCVPAPNAWALRCGCGFLLYGGGGGGESRTDVAFSTGLGPSLAALHLKEEVCICVCVCVCAYVWRAGGACCANLFSLVFTRPLQTCNDMHVNCWSRERIAVCSHQVSGCTEPTPALSRYLFHSTLHSASDWLTTFIIDLFITFLINQSVVLPLKWWWMPQMSQRYRIYSHRGTKKPENIHNI